VSELLAELDSARGAFLEALGDVDEELVTTPGVVDGWSVRDLVVHVAFWSQHAAGALELAAAGRGAEFAYDSAQTDAMNEDVLHEAQAIDPSTALEREDRAFTAFRDLLAGLDERLLDLRLGNGDSVEQVVRYDGPEHYAEHTAHLRAWWSGDEEHDDE
jgi:hypothetical protein